MFGDGIQYPFDGACLNHVTVGTTSIHCYEGNSINYESSLSTVAVFRQGPSHLLFKALPQYCGAFHDFSPRILKVCIMCMNMSRYCIWRYLVSCVLEIYCVPKFLVPVG